jgi:uncharacterized protein YndB with AHSA1/START domain
MRTRPSRFVSCLALVLSVAAAPFVAADVADVGDNGFTLKSTLRLSVPPEKAWAAAVEVGKWWSSEHTYSGDAANLTLDARPGGCWCEKLPGGSAGVQHMTVVFASPGKSLRLAGGLGPLQSMGVAGSMTWTFAPAEKGTTVQLTYAVGGYTPGGFKDLAPGVDSVLKAQLGRFKNYAETGKP